MNRSLPNGQAELRLLSISQIRREYGWSPSTVGRIRNTSVGFPMFQIGAKWYARRADLEAFLAAKIDATAKEAA